MKKLLTIVLVFVLAQSAFGVGGILESGGESNLVLGVDVTVGDTIQVDLTWNAESTGIQYIDFETSGTSAPTLAVGGWIGGFDNIAAIDGTLTGGDIIDAASSLTAGWSLGTGSLGVGTGTILYSFNATVNGEGQIDTAHQAGDLYYDKNNTGGTTYYIGPEGGLVITPEPMTIVLLGLGGLFLSRRRK